jgi:hypothetical protein
MYAKEPLTYIKGLNAVLKNLQKTASFTLKYPKLDINWLTLKVYMDASYANNYDESSQLGYITFQADASGKCQPIVWSSHKSRRVTRPMLESETMEFGDGFDAAYSLKHDLQTILKRSVDTRMYNDSLLFFGSHYKVVRNSREAVDDRPDRGEKSIRLHRNRADRISSHQLEPG